MLKTYEEVSADINFNSNAACIEFDLAGDEVVSFQGELTGGGWGVGVLALEASLGVGWGAVLDDLGVPITIAADGGLVRNLDVATLPRVRFRVSAVAGVTSTVRVRKCSKREV